MKKENLLSRPRGRLLSYLKLPALNLNTLQYFLLLNSENIVLVKSPLMMSSKDKIKVPFGVFKKGQIPGAVTAINTADLLTYDQGKDFYSAILGKVPGYFGSDDNRGLGAPLIVVDGVPRSGDGLQSADDRSDNCCQ